MDSFIKFTGEVENVIQKAKDELFTKEEEIQRQFDRLSKEKEEMGKRYQIQENIIELNVGGKYFTTYKDNLIKYEGTMLEAMFSGRHPSTKDSKGRYFIDRNGKIFSLILEFLRTGIFFLPTSSPDYDLIKQQLRLELEYFGLTEVSEVKSLFQNFEGTSLLTEDHIAHLTLWYGQEKDWKLLYKATRDGFASSDFHTRCDHKGETITVVHSDNGSLFGGYNPINWTSSGSYATDPTYRAWLFSLENPSKTPVKIPQMANSSNGTYNSAGNGPVFGGGHDLCIYSNSNTNPSNYTNLGNTYHLSNVPQGVQPATFLVGTKNFKVVDIEVFGRK